MLEYARWKYVLVGVVLLLSLLFALPNVFGDDPALQVARADHIPLTADATTTVVGYLKDQKVNV
jgi:preprotein translocase subunit SecD